MDAFTLGMLGLLIFFTVVTGGSLYLYHEKQKEKASQRLKSNCDNERKGQQ